MRKLFLSIAIALAAVLPVSAADFMETGMPDKTVGIGLRFGINTTGQKTKLGSYSDNVSINNGTGFTVGAVVDLNVRRYFSVQPGIFFENRSFDYTVVRHSSADRTLQNNLGHTRSYSFTIPVLASFRFNLSENVQWNVEVGPYFAFGIGGGDNMDDIITKVPADGTSGIYNHEYYDRDFYGDATWQHRKFDWGSKIGTGIRVKERYSFNIHYMCGFKDLSADKNWTMKNRSWTFSVGYGF